MGFLSIARKGLSYGRRALNVAPEFLLGDSSEVIGNAMRKQKGSIFEKAKAGAKALEADVLAKQKLQGGFAKRVIKNLDPRIYGGFAKEGAKAAKLAGKNKFIGGLKGLGKGIAKKMPFIGAALTIAFEAPNLYTAFKEGGFKAGMKEVGGATIELGCMAAGAAIGSAICPGIGTIIGGILGAIGGSLLRGKTYSEKKAEAEAVAQLPQYSKEDIEKLYSYGFTDEEIAQFRENGYTMDDINKAIEEELKNNPLNQEIVAPQDNTRVVKPGFSEVSELENENLRLKEELSKLQQQQTYNPWISMYQQPYMNSFGMTNNPYMFGGMYGLNNNLYATASPFQMPFGNLFTYNPQNQYFRYSG